MASEEGPSNPSAIDKSLLARLNALRPSPISLSEKPVLDAKTAGETSDAKTDLAKRFAKLGNKSDLSSAAAPIRPASPSFDSPNVQDEESENNENDRTLDELLSEIGPRKKWDIDEREASDASKLVDEAKEALNQVTKLSPEDESPNDDHMVGEEENSKATGLTEEQEADEYVQRVLAEIELERQHGKLSGDEGLQADAAQGKEQSPSPPLPTQGTLKADVQSSEHDSKEFSDINDTIIDLPSAPTAIPLIQHKPEADEWDAFLPSAPTSVPTTSLPTYTSEEIDTWCIICNDDASVRCLGCDGDLYCTACWNEGHRGPDAGFEERSHKAIAYAKPKPSEKGKKSSAKQRKLAA